VAITDPLILPSDVLLIPVMDLSEELRKQFEAEAGDYAITRPRSRTPSKIVDARVAALLKEFRKATTIVQAVISYSQANQLNPEQTLEEVFPVLQRFMRAQILVPPDSAAAIQIEASFKSGDRVSEFKVVRDIQILEDTELYQAKTDVGELVALKILRPDCNQDMENTFKQETAVLQYLDGKVNAKLLLAGTFENRPYIALEWCHGVPISIAAEDLRRRNSSFKAQEDLLSLCCSILEAYAHLHLQKVIHSDVHPRNILVDHNGTVRIIDFGLARVDGMHNRNPHRGGIGYFYEPEYAIARLNQHHLPKSSMLGEQYALAALLYLLLTGAHYLDFSSEKHEMLRQIAEDRPLPFAQRGVSWPEVEALLSKSLNKDPSDRFNSVAELTEQFKKIEVSERQEFPVGENEVITLKGTDAEALVNDVLRRVDIGGPLFKSGVRTAPTCSINYGAAGIAYALYRIACVRNDASLLSLADMWATRSIATMDSSSAFYSKEIEITPATVGQIALYHTASGVHAARALISHAMGDMVSQRAALEAFVASSKAACKNLDLTLGRSGTLIGSSLLLDAPAVSKLVNQAPLLELGDDVLIGLWKDLNAMGSFQECKKLTHLGIAHGWAGILYATLRWCLSTNRPLPAGFEERLHQLAECAEPAGRGARWRVRARKHGRASRGDYRFAGDYMTGWCNGSAGYIFLWVLAYRMFRDETYLKLAEKAAWNVWQEENIIDSLCCGLAGAAYGILNLYKCNGEKQWLHRALDLANRAIIVTRQSQFRDSLYKGTLGVAVLIADLDKPDSACMPLFEDEGWPIPESLNL
jgi:serine/threonine protein kinase